MKRYLYLSLFALAAASTCNDDCSDGCEIGDLPQNCVSIDIGGGLTQIVCDR